MYSVGSRRKPADHSRSARPVPAFARAAVVSAPLHASRASALGGDVAAQRAVFVLLAGRQRVGVPERPHFLVAHSLPAGGDRTGREQPDRENELTRPDAVPGDVLPDHVRDLGINLHLAVLAVRLTCGFGGR
jgi:hypothetical protein